MSEHDEIRRTAVNQRPYGGTDWPFVAPSSLCGEILDAYFVFTAGDPCVVSDPITLTLSEISGGFRFILTNSDSQVIGTFDNPAAVVVPWGARSVYQWMTSTSVFRVVVVPSLLTSGSGVLDAKTVHRMPPRVTSITVGNAILKGRLGLIDGFNCHMTVAPQVRVDGGRFVNRVTLDLTPGGGLGKRPGCDETVQAVRTINGVGPDPAGNFIVDAEGCYRQQIPVTIQPGEIRTATYGTDTLLPDEAKAAVSLHNNCQPCCRCDYYTNTYKGLRRVWFMWKDTTVRAEAVRDQYAENRDRWLAQRNCRISNPARLVVIPEPACSIQIGGMFCNASKECLRDFQIVFDIQLYDGSTPVSSGGVVNDTQVSGSFTTGPEGFVLSGFYPNLIAPIPYANPQASTTVQFRVCIADCSTANVAKVTMTVRDADDVVITTLVKAVPMNPAPRTIRCEC